MPHELETWEERFERIRAEYLAEPMVEITEERFHDMLEVLPPKGWTKSDGIERFCMIEHMIDDVTDQFAHRNGRYFTKKVACGNHTTYITADMVDEYIRTHDALQSSEN